MSIDLLQSKIRKLKTPIVVGLDPTPELIPPELLAECEARLGKTPEALAESYGLFCKTLLDGLKKAVPAVKVQTACFSALGWQGVKVMQEVLASAKKLGYYVLLETMRSDVGHIAALTAESVFGGLEFDGVRSIPYPCDALVLNGYLGSDGIKPYLPWLKGENAKNIFVVVRSSNRSAAEVQDLISGDRVVHRAMADLTLRWSMDLFGKCGYGEVGAVVGAASPGAVQELRKRYDTLFFLVPGCGAQGCAVKHAACAFDRLGHGAALCVSRSVIGAWREQEGTAFPEAALAAVEKLKRQLERYVTVL
ncbi:MAG: orotidine-5'-phosphate decarboxylase [Oscillospiraceae bacterium]|nr:orotidine-5'-phosphate decarboxylase [Oscillospiraceae bacterium]